MKMQRLPATAAWLALALLMTGCAGTQSEPEIQTSNREVLNNTETAPADLQLTCASAAANQFGILPDKILPVASSKLPDETYQVQLTADGQNFLCTIDNSANVISVTPA